MTGSGSPGSFSFFFRFFFRFFYSFSFSFSDFFKISEFFN